MLNITDLWRNPNQTFIIKDYETENLSLVNQRPWQLSYLVCRGGKIVDEVDDYIYIPDLNISIDAQRITNFDKAKYNRLAKPKDEVLARWKLKSKDAILVAHNGLGFDAYIMRLFYDYCGEPFDWNDWRKWIDTNALAKSYLTNRKNNSFETWEDFLCWQLSCLTIRDRKIKTSQKSLLKQFGIPFDENRLHDAIYDVGCTKQILEKLLYGLKL